jgi:hypothetical protein
VKVFSDFASEPDFLQRNHSFCIKSLSEKRIFSSCGDCGAKIIFPQFVIIILAFMYHFTGD